MKITVLLELSRLKGSKRRHRGFLPPRHFSLLHFHFSSICFKYVVFMFAFATYISTVQPGGFARPNFTPTPGFIQQAGGGAGLSLVVSTHIFLGDVQKENIFQRLLAPEPPVLLIVWMFKNKISFSVSKNRVLELV